MSSLEVPCGIGESASKRSSSTSCGGGYSPWRQQRPCRQQRTSHRQETRHHLEEDSTSVVSHQSGTSTRISAVGGGSGSGLCALSGSNRSSGRVPAGLAYFSIDELTKGSFHSRNYWTEAYNLDEIQCHPQTPATDTNINPIIQVARATLQEEVQHSRRRNNSVRKQNKKQNNHYQHPAYIIKHIPQHFMSKKYGEFEAAASYLEQEALMMQALQHEHILSLRATALGGVEAYYSTGGRCSEAFFLILPKIAESLEQRMLHWKRQQSRHCMVMSLLCLTGSGEGSSSRSRTHDRSILKRLKVAYEISNALSYMHSQGIAYRNFGMDKVGFTTDKVVQLMELGDAERINESRTGESPTLTTTLLKSSLSSSKRPPRQASVHLDRRVTSYSAPEITMLLSSQGMEESDGTSGPRDLTCKADSYSFSKLLSEMLTLVVVRPDSTPKEMEAYITGFERVGRRLSKKCLDVMQRGASLHPSHRPTMPAYCRALQETMVNLEASAAATSEKLSSYIDRRYSNGAFTDSLGASPTMSHSSRKATSVTIGRRSTGSSALGGRVSSISYNSEEAAY